MTAEDYTLLCVLEHIARQSRRSQASTLAPVGIYEALAERGWMKQVRADGNALVFNVTRCGMRELECWIATQAGVPR